MKKYYWFFFAILLVLTGANLYLYYVHHQMTHIVCQGSTTVRDENNLLNVHVSLSLSGHIGQIIVNGELTDEKGNIRSVHRSSSFTFKQNGNNLYITNYSVAELADNAVDQATLREFLPPYHLLKGISTIVGIYPISPRSYLTTGDNYMHLICDK